MTAVVAPTSDSLKVLTPMASKPNQPLLPGMSDESENSAQPSSAAATPSNPRVSSPNPIASPPPATDQASIKANPKLSLPTQENSPSANVMDSAAENNAENNTEYLQIDVTTALAKDNGIDSSKSKNLKTNSPTPGNCPLVVVVDTSAILYQMFHALPPMTSPQGMPVGAVHGFLRDLLEIQNRYHPDYLFFAFDLSEITFRNELYPEYKAHRDEMPADLRLQIPLVRQALEALNVPILEQPGFEADDLIATIATQSEQRGWRCLIVSPDKDCRQLLSDRIDILNLRKKELFTQTNLKEEWGITPEQVIDFQAMVGDSADNVPGIPLIGPKIAQQLLEQYGSLDQILQHPNAVSGQKRRENMVTYREQALISRKLVTLCRDVPATINWQPHTSQLIDREKLQALFQQLGFRKMAERFLQNSSDTLENSTSSTLSPQPQSPQLEDSLNLSSDSSSEIAKRLSFDNYQLILDESALIQLCQDLRNASFIAIDTETTSTQPRWAKPVGYSFSWGEGRGAYIPIRAPLGEPRLDIELVHQHLKPILEDPQIRKVGQNLKYDVIIFRSQGIDVQGIFFDTMVADYLIDPGQRNHSLDDLAKRYLQHETIKISELIGTGRTQKCMDEVPLEAISHYAIEDAEVPWQLTPTLQERLKQLDLLELFDSLEIPLLSVLAEMEFNGITIDTDRLKQLSQRFELRLNELYDEIQQQAPEPFNPDSPKQLAKVLFEHLKLPVIKRTKTGPSTDAEVLQELAPLHPLPARIIEYRQLAKLKSTYVDSLPELVCPASGRIHTSFRQDVAATGRLSSSEPNLQNIPIRTEEGREIRSAFKPAPDDWVLLTADYSQIELRVLAHYCGDAALREAFEKDQDIHRRVAAEVYGVTPEEVTGAMRRSAKAINFGIIYGQSPFGLAKALQIPKDEAATFIDAYFARYPGVQSFILDTLSQCQKQGFVSTMLGRRRILQGVRDLRTLPPEKRRTLTEPERMAVNTVIQGSAADLIKLAMVRVYRLLKSSSLRARLLLQIHDELVFEVHPDDLQKLREQILPLMTQCDTLSIPLKVDTKSGRNWAECEPLE